MQPLPTFDKATVSALHKGDESALQRILHDGYAAMVEEAGRVLGSPAAAPRVVQDAMVQVWETRAGIEDADDLDKAIHDAVRGNATRHARRAQQGGQPQGDMPTSLEQVSASVSAAARVPRADPHAGHAAHASKAGHVAGSHIADIQKKSWKVPVLTGVAVLAITSGILWWVNRKGAESNVSQSLISPDAKHLASAPGQRAAMTLSDDSKVSLGSDSQVIVPSSFDEKGRVVRLEGTATFTIKPDVTKPFEVRAGNAVIVATGTEFSVRAFADEDHVTVKVKEGNVSVQGGAAPARTVAPGAAISVAKDGSMSEPTPEVLGAAFSWMDGKVVIENRSIKEALVELRRWYGLELVVRDSSLLTRPVTLSVPLSSKMDAIGALEKSGHVKFTYEKQTPVLVDGPAGAKAPAKAAAKKAK